MLTQETFDWTFHTTCSHGFACCSIKSIGQVSLYNKTAPYLVPSVLIRVVTVPCLMVHRVSSEVCQTALQDASNHIAEMSKNDSCAPFSYQAIQSQNIPIKRTRIEIWANNPTNGKKWIVLLSHQQFSLTCSSLLCWSETHKRFLHACTPVRRTRALVHLFTQRKHGQAPHTQKHILQKMVEVHKRWAMFQAVAQVNPTAQNTSRLHECFALYKMFRR